MVGGTIFKFSPFLLSKVSCIYFEKALEKLGAEGLALGPNGEVTLLIKGFEPATFYSQAQRPDLLSHTTPQH